MAYKEVWNADILLLQYIFLLTPIYEGYSFCPDKEFTSDELELFAKQTLNLKKEIEGQLHVEVRNDVLKKPTSQLKTFLRLVGLDFNKTRTRANGGIKKRYYSLDKDSLDKIQTFAAARQKARSGRLLPETA